MTQTPFHYPLLSTHDWGVVRSPGPGLGNLLFPITRALIGARRHGGTFIYPTMRQIKLGTFLRGERDKRTYGNLFRSRKSVDWNEWIKAKSRLQVVEQQFNGNQIAVTVCYSGLRGYFNDIREHQGLIANWILKNVRLVGPVSTPYDIGIHIRQGDFAKTEISNTGPNTRLPLEWYRGALKEAQTLLGVSRPKILLFTDSDVEQVSKMLGVDDVAVDPSRNAMTAIMNLSKAKIIITSRSTFSMWATYLGNAPAIWDESFDLSRYFPPREGLDVRF